MVIRHFFVFLLISVIARLWGEISIFSDMPYDSEGGYFRGILSDSVISLLMAWVLTFIRRPFATHILYGMWAAIHAANLMHIRVNYVNIDWADIGHLTEKEFLTGVGISWDVISTWLVLWGGAVLASYAWNLSSQRNIPPSRFKPMLAVVTGVALLGFLPAQGESWRQFHGIEENIREILLSEPYQRQVASPEVEALYKRMTALDLGGKPVISYPKKRPNILMIVVERLSDFHIHAGQMPYLQSLAQDTLYYPNFIYPQQYTLNGLYSILCGDYPALTKHNLRDHRQNKWYATISFGSRHACLPEILADNGYTSLFFQASGLNYTLKRKFFQRVGFHQAYSARRLIKEAQLQIPLQRSFMGWGMADDMFMTLVADKLINMEHSKSGQPWFAALMTTGTHVPYNVPSEYAEQFPSRKEAAYHFADIALRYMMEKLEKHHLLDNTVVLIMGDESHERRNRADQFGLITKNWGTLLIRTPQKDRAVIREYFTQADIKTSLLDYTGIQHPHTRFRSVFRHYDTFRPLMFASAFTKYWAAMPESGRLIFCRYDLTKCKNKYFTGELFDTVFENGELTDDIQLYNDTAKKSDHYISDHTGRAL